MFFSVSFIILIDITRPFVKRPYPKTFYNRMKKLCDVIASFCEKVVKLFARTYF